MEEKYLVVIIKEDNFFLTHEGLSARTGDYLGFTLNKEQLLPCIEKYEEYENRLLFENKQTFCCCLKTNKPFVCLQASLRFSLFANTQRETQTTNNKLGAATKWFGGEWDPVHILFINWIFKKTTWKNKMEKR